MIECGFLTSRAHDGVQTVFQGVFVADAAHLLAHFTSHFNILETILAIVAGPDRFYSLAQSKLHFDILWVIHDI
jgi:hypothetical protein